MQKHGEILLNNSDIKEAKVMYGSGDSTSTGTAVYLEIDFTKDGTKKFEEITTTYIPSNSSDQENKAEENSEETEKKVSLKIDGNELMSTSFDEPIRTGKLQLTVGSASTDAKTLNENIKRASSMATILDAGNMPLKYDIEENQYIMPEFTETQLQYLLIAIVVVIIIGILIFIFRYKVMGLLAGIAYIGLISTYLLVIRYTNVSISIEGILGIIAILILNYIFINKLLVNIKKVSLKPTKEEVITAEKETFKDFFVKLIPICIATIVFCFVQWATITSFGMVMFWGILLIVIYNYIVTNNLLKIKADN